MLWVVRLSLRLGRTPAELAEVLTAGDLALYQAAVEIDGPWWGEHEAALMRQLCAVQAAAAGADLTPDDFRISWTVGPAADAAGDAPNLLPPADGLEVFATRYGLTVDRVEGVDDGTGEHR